MSEAVASVLKGNARPPDLRTLGGTEMTKLIGTTLAALLLLGSAGMTSAADLSISGKWSGTYTNSRGETGDDSLAVKERKGGTLLGSWGEITIKGNRLGEDVFLCKGSK